MWSSVRWLWVPLLVTGAGVLGCVGEIAEPYSGGSGGSGSASQPLCTDSPFARRLTVDEYIASVQAALGVDVSTEAAALLPADLRTDGFTNTRGALIVTLKHVERYAEIAEIAVSRIPDLDALVNAHTSCTELTEACGGQLVSNLGKQIYRRPLVAEERASLTPIFQTVAAEGEGFGVAAALTIQAMLQAPGFLYRTEADAPKGQRELDAHELAQRLSYLVWGAPPDPQLFARAEAGQLTDADAIAQELDRMLDDPRARATSRRYVRDWLDLDRLNQLLRDPARFPGWKPEFAAAMKQETLDFAEHVLWDLERPVSDLFNANVTFAGPELAQYYGLSPAASGKLDLADVPERGGLLTQGALLTLGGPNASMVGRGLFLFEHLLCGEISSPPPGVDTSPPPIVPGASQRDYSEDRVNAEACGGCHSQMEPIAWGLERFDASGAYVLEDPFGNPMQEDGWVQFPDAETKSAYATSAALMDLLAESPAVRACFSRKSAQFALGRALHPGREADSCTIAEVSQRFSASSGTYRELLASIALSRAFRTVHAEE
jgi:hypothetical protein